MFACFRKSKKRKDKKDQPVVKIEFFDLPGHRILDDPKKLHKRSENWRSNNRKLFPLFS